MKWPFRISDSTNNQLYFKHKKLASIVCCPNCHADIIHESAFFVSRVPFVAKLRCNECGDIGAIQNLKYMFSFSENIRFPAVDYSTDSSLKIVGIDLKTSYFSPKNQWVEEGNFIRSSTPGSKFSLRSNKLAMAIVLLKHPWSGIARFLVDGEELGRIDLFEEKGSMQVWCPLYLGEGEHLVEVEVTGKKNPLAKDTQIVMIGAESAELENSSDSTITYSSRNEGNPYPDFFSGLIELVNQDGLILDCGSGDRSHPDPRVINFEYSMFRSPDVFGDGHRLPFKDNSFDLVLSQAVIEHLYDPFKAVSEILRVLKPGGTVYAESAFMQPLHAVPYHFFNTTGWGLEHLFKNFEVTEVNYCGPLAETLKWFYELTALRDKGFGNEIDNILSSVAELDNHITSEELCSFASYVTLLATKPLEAIKDNV